MASLRQIRRRMKAIESITEITKAMEMISAFRFKKAENRFSRTRAYFAEMEKLAANLAAGSGARQGQALFEPRIVARKALVVMTGDKGLCGAYNTNLLRSAQAWLGENRSLGPAIIPVGKVGYEFFRKRHFEFPASFPEKAAVDLTAAKRLATQLKALFLTKSFDAVDVLYTTFRVGGTGRIRIEPYLGLAYLVGAGAPDTDYLFEPDFKGVFEPLLSGFLEGKLYMLLLESLTSEYAARMVAMKQATENGEEVLDSLKLLRNKTRQATITRELSEIVSGASVLV